MAESPKRSADVSLADASRVAVPARPASLTGETTRAADSVPVATGPFTVLPIRFGRYRIDRLLGQGSMGAVYLAHDIQLDRSVALKVARVSTAGSAKLIQRMETEAKAAAKIDHPQICKVYDFGEINGIRFISLQYIEGENLKSYLKRVGRQRKPVEAVNLILQLARALRVAHEKGVIHRDLKPENVMLNLNGDPVIMDFGLARRTTGATDAGLTQGMIVGTAAYMAPEQAIGKAEGIDYRSDLYALGVILFEMLTGDWPFKGGAIELMGRKCVQDAPSPLSVNADVPPRLAEVCHKLIAQKKEDRYANCAELIAALEGIALNLPSQYGIDVEPNSPLEKASGTSEALRKSENNEVPESSRHQFQRSVSPDFGEIGLQVAKPETKPVTLQETQSFESPTVLPDAVPTLRTVPIDRRISPHKPALSAGAALFQGGPTGRKRFMAAGGAAGLALLGVIIITITNSDGTKARIELPDTSKVEVVTTLSPIPPPSTLAPPLAAGRPAEAPKPAVVSLDATQPLLAAVTTPAPATDSPKAPRTQAPEMTSVSTGMKLVLIPAGTFMMGSPDWEAERQADEGPQHTVKISQSFYMGVFEVTQGQYEHVMGTNPSQFKHALGHDTSTFPVDHMSWFDAVEFCNKLSNKDGLTECYRLTKMEHKDGSIRSAHVSITGGTGYRLPTEAQWEYACRGNTSTPFHFGSTLNGEQANVDGLHFPYGTEKKGKYLKRTTTVGSHGPNPFGLYDMHCNVFEWCEDSYADDAYEQFRTRAAVDPSGAPTSVKRVMRGGSWFSRPSEARAADRGAEPPGHCLNRFGFRVVTAGRGTP